MKNDVHERKVLHAAVWRWHFYAGLYVAPFLMLLAITGLVMLAKEPIERWQFGALLTNTSGGSPTLHQARLDAARSAFPNATIVRYQPGRDSSEVTRVTVTIDGRPHTVFVDASTGQIRGIVDDGHRIGVVAGLLHGTLLMGPWGDRLIEIAASLGILLIVSGVYLWFPKRTPFWQSIRMSGGGRLAWRNLHKTTGVVLAPVLAFYLLSGLVWTDVWGEQFVQAWSTLRAAKAPPGESAAHTHETLNAGSGKVVPWNLEQTPLPPSSAHAGHDRITLDAAIAVAQREGIGQRFWVGVPGGIDGIWTIAQTAMNDDITDPTQELTVHVDQYTAAVVGRGGWNDYTLMARAVAAGIPLHTGSLGWWNLLGASVVCLSVIALSLSGLVMWWLRRPARGWQLAAPPRPDPARVPLVTWAAALVLGVMFPLGGAAIVGVAVLDWTLVRRVALIRQLLN
jgi:uncharacterized iron-regulated membrane protein